MRYYVYMLENSSKRHYIGIAIDPNKRLVEHNKGSTKSTKPFRPWKIIYVEEHISRRDACRREWHLKHPKGYREKLRIIKNYGEVA